MKTSLMNWLPPALVPSIRNLLGKGIRFNGNYSSWAEAAALCTGYDSDLIFEKVLDATLKVKNGEAAFERDSVLFEEVQYSWPITAALMWVAARNEGRLHVLDFGGSLGSSYFQNRKFLPSLKLVSWHIVEQQHFVDKGKVFIENDELKFYSSIQESIESVAPNVILLSSVVQYLPNFQWLLDKINYVEADTLIIDRTPFTDKIENSLCIQTVPSHIYKASYPMWLISRKRFLNQLSNWKVLEKFNCPEGQMISEVGIKFEFSGYIFERINA